MDWQPIETAPRDGSRIQIYVPSTSNIDVIGEPEEITDHDRWTAACTGVFAGHFLNGRWNVGNTEAYDSSFTVEPTHWMPLPTPPIIHT